MRKIFHHPANLSIMPTFLPPFDNGDCLNDKMEKCSAWVYCVSHTGSFYRSYRRTSMYCPMLFACLCFSKFSFCLLTLGVFLYRRIARIVRRLVVSNNENFWLDWVLERFIFESTNHAIVCSLVLIRNLSERQPSNYQ